MTPIKRTIAAQSIVKQLMHGGAKNTTFVLRNTRILGTLDLRYLIIERPVRFSNCEFAAVDLRYCEFKQVVDFSGCTFSREFNSGDDVQSHTIFRKDLICNGAVFKDSACFNGCRVEGSAYFSGATFGSTGKPTDFTMAAIGKTLECNDATFFGPAHFVSIECGGGGYFTDAVFASTADVLFNSATFGGSLVCINTVFKGWTNFQLLNCGGAGVFRRAQFEGEGGANFVQASFASNIEFTITKFLGPAIFNSVRCGLDGFFHSARFCDYAEFGYASFEGNLDCVGAAFEGEAQFVALQCRNLSCNDATFHGLVRFNHVECRDSGYFDRARFLGIQEASFNYASVKNTLSFIDAEFQGPAQFGAVQCDGGGFLRGVHFRHSGDVNFSQASFGKNLEFQRARFGGAATFTSLQCGGDVFLSGANFNSIDFRFASINGTLFCAPVMVNTATMLPTIFGGAADFSQFQCSRLDLRGAIFIGPTYFRLSRFRNEAAFLGVSFSAWVDFSHAVVGVALQFATVQFGSKVSFDALSCGASAYFHDVRFGSVDFNQAHLGKNLECANAIFEGPASFKSLRCAQSARFNRTRFRDDVDFSLSTFGENLECTGDQTVFERRAVMNRVRCEGSGLFDDVQFLSVFRPEEVDFEYAYFGLSLNFGGAHFAGPANLSKVQVSRELRLSGAYFGQDLSLRGARLGALAVESDIVPFKRASSDLRECKFDRFLGREGMAEKLARAQNPTKFSIDPYLQLERYYISIGDEVKAKDVHYLGRRDARESAKDKQRGAIKWSRGTRRGDWWIKWLSGYGVRTPRLLGWIAVCLVIGTLVFWSGDSLTPKQSASTVGVPGGQDAHAVASMSAPRSDDRDPQDWIQPFDPFAYSMDLFLPIVNLHVDEKWEPRSEWRQEYAFFHALAGWLLVPLLVASLAGVVRRQ